jgi:hypothetical protein
MELVELDYTKVAKDILTPSHIRLSMDLPPTQK